MTYLCPRVYSAPYPDGPLWIVSTSDRCRRYRRRWVAELVAFFVQRLGSNEPIGRYVRQRDRAERRDRRRRLGKRITLMQAYGGDPDNA